MFLPQRRFHARLTELRSQHQSVTAKQFSNGYGLKWLQALKKDALKANVELAQSASTALR
tara:strand:+ start:317 stop:496 length:180 start_codon:yes stop_codon:yes gene_type:complete